MARPIPEPVKFSGELTIVEPRTNALLHNVVSPPFPIWFVPLFFYIETR